MTPWSGAEQAELPPLTHSEKVRLALRAVWAVLCLGFFFALFLGVRAVEWLAGKLSGREPRAAGAAVVRLWARLALPTLGLRYRQTGEPMGQGGAFVANHSSWVDIVALQAAAAPFLVSKAEVRSWPGIGLIGRAIGTLFIERSPAAAKHQEAELRARLMRGDRMALFPEGTSTDGQRVLPFKSSLFAVFCHQDLAAEVAVQPVTITYRTRAGLPASFYAWWGGMEFGTHLASVLARSTGGEVELVFHEPHTAGEAGGRKALAAEARQAVVGAHPGCVGQ